MTEREDGVMTEVEKCPWFVNTEPSVEQRLQAAIQALMQIASGDGGYCPDWHENPCDAHGLAEDTLEWINVEPRQRICFPGGGPSLAMWPKAEKFWRVHG